jgi:hypothetical protein
LKVFRIAVDLSSAPFDESIRFLWITFPGTHRHVIRDQSSEKVLAKDRSIQVTANDASDPETTDIDQFRITGDSKQEMQQFLWAPYWVRIEVMIVAKSKLAHLSIPWNISIVGEDDLEVLRHFDGL